MRVMMTKKTLSLNEYLKKVKPYLRNITINLQNYDACKIQLTIAINSASPKNAKEEPAMHSSSSNIKLAPYSDANDLIDKLFKPLRSINQKKLETSMERSDFIFDLVQLMYYKCHKVSFIRGGSYIDSLDWIKKKKKATINLNNTDDKYFQYATTVVLSYEEIESHLERVSSIKPFINKYNWEGIN